MSRKNVGSTKLRLTVQYANGGGWAGPDPYRSRRGQPRSLQRDRDHRTRTARSAADLDRERRRNGL